MSKTDGITGRRKKRTWLVIAAGALVLVGILAGGTILMNRSAHRDASNAARSVSLLYLEAPDP